MQLGLEGAKTVYLFMGHIKPYKGVEDFIESFKAIREDGVRLLVVGQPLDEETGSRIRAAAAGDQRIDLALHYIPDDSVQLYMNAADVVVFPLRKMHTSGSILLMMSFAKPVIAPAIASVPEYVGQDAGILFDPVDPDGLRKALVMARGQPLEEMGRAGYEQVVHHGWREFAVKHAGISRRLLPPELLFWVAAVSLLPV